MSRNFVRESMILCLAVLGPACTAAVSAQNFPDSPKCSPPIPRNISLAIAVSVDGGGPAVAGSSGTLEFTIRNLQASGSPQPAIVSHFPYHGLPIDPAQPLRIAAADVDACFFTEQVQTVDSDAQMFYTIHAAAADPEGSSSCRVSFDVDDAVESLAMQWTAMPSSLCAGDVDHSDNNATLVFGDVAGLPPAQAVPALGSGVFAWVGWTMLLVAFSALARRALRA